jgi:hypothetical protein
LVLSLLFTLSVENMFDTERGGEYTSGGVDVIRSHGPLLCADVGLALGREDLPAEKIPN